MARRIVDAVPDFSADTTEGTIGLHDRIGDGWVMRLSVPRDFAPVCRAEFGHSASLTPEFEKRDCKASCTALPSRT